MDRTASHQSVVASGDSKNGHLVDEELRERVFRPWRICSVHIRAFHGAWASFFVAMFAAFAPAALTVPIRDTLNLDESDIALGNSLTLAGTALCRILLGSLCDAYGPKIVMTTILLVTGIPLFSITVVNGPVGHAICRPLIALSMGCQTVSIYWCSLMFVDDVVGAANSTTLGLAEAGFGVAQLLLPAIFLLLSKRLEPFVAWRVTLLLPGVMQLLTTVYILVATQDRPGRFQTTPQTRPESRSSARKRWTVAVTNYRTWVFMLVYGVVLGTGLSIYNVITSYYFDNFDISFATAGALGSLAGLVNALYMPLGGYLSDLVARHGGMRGRLWFATLAMLSLGNALILLSMAHESLTLSIVAMQFVLAFIAIFAAALFSCTPFVSHRALGLVQGIVGSGSNSIGSILQEVLFNKARMDTHRGFFWAGVTILLSSSLMSAIYYPMWGGLLRKPAPGVPETEYYLAEYTQEEIQMGLAETSIRFAQQAASERCQGGQQGR